MKPLVAAAAVLLVGSLAACSNEADRAIDAAASDSPATPVSSPTAVPKASGDVRTRIPTMVLDDGDGAELCLGGVAESFPPQCGGPRLIGWDWSEHPEHETARGVRWGEFAVQGTFDGTAITPSLVTPAAADDTEPMPEKPRLVTPCEEPEGGWQVVDPALTTPESMDAAFQAADRLPDLAMAWMDQSPFGKKARPNDPTTVVINVAVTQDRAGAEKRLREVWGGALCVSEAVHSQRELEEISRELATFPGFLGGGGAARPDHLELSVIYDDGSLQAWADQTYGKGVVSVTSALVSVEG
jgi:hypothetical protein